MRSPQPGDLQFTFHPGGILSEAIAFVTHAKISHVQMIVDVGANGALQVISAEAEGLVPKWNHPKDYPWQCILWDERLGAPERLLLTEWMWAKQKAGTPYDIWGLASFIVNIDLNNERRSFCSEVNFQAYEENGLPPIVDGIDHSKVAPVHLYISPVLNTLDGSKKEVR